MTPRSLALVLGVVYLGLGALGLMPGALGGMTRVRPGDGWVAQMVRAWDS